MSVKYQCRAENEGGEEGRESERGRFSVLALYSAGGGGPGGRGRCDTWSDELFLIVTLDGFERHKTGSAVARIREVMIGPEKKAGILEMFGRHGVRLMEKVDKDES